MNPFLDLRGLMPASVRILILNSNIDISCHMLGRSVPVNNEKSFSGAYMELQQILRRNLVSYELRLAERHEKKGYKRRRLASDRHRRRFAHEVCSAPTQVSVHRISNNYS